MVELAGKNRQELFDCNSDGRRRLLLDRADKKKPVWLDLLFVGALKAQTSLPDEELHTPGEPEPSINAEVRA